MSLHTMDYGEERFRAVGMANGLLIAPGRHLRPVAKVKRIRWALKLSRASSSGAIEWR